MSANSEMASYLRSEASKVNQGDYVSLYQALVLEIARGLEADDAEIKRLTLELQAEKHQVETLEQLLDELGKQIDEALARENGK